VKELYYIIKKSYDKTQELFQHKPTASLFLTPKHSFENSGNHCQRWFAQGTERITATSHKTTPSTKEPARQPCSCRNLWNHWRMSLSFIIISNLT